MDDDGLTCSSEDEALAEAASGRSDETAAAFCNGTNPSRFCNNRDLNDKLVRLERENFQLKLRIHLSETEGKIVDSRCTNPPAICTVKTSRETALEEEIASLKEDKLKLEHRVQEAESKLQVEIKTKEDLLQKETAVLNKFTELRQYASTLERKVVQLQRQGSSQLYSPDGKPLVRSHPMSPLCGSLFTNAKCFETSTPVPKLNAAQYEQDLEKLANLQAEYDMAKRDFERVLEERNGLVAQLNQTRESCQSYVRDTEAKYGTLIDRLTQDNERLQKLNAQLQLSLREAEGRTVALSNAAKLEMSNQLRIHQNALEKVHREQAILISELQALKKVSSCSPSGLMKSIGELEKHTRPCNVPTGRAATLIPRCTTARASSRVKEPCSLNFSDDNDDVEPGIFQVEQPPEEQLRRAPSSELGFHYENNIELMNKQLREKNSRLAIKLQQTRNSLKKAIELLEHSEKDKEGMEKVICRQLHRTHKILSEVKETLSKPKSGTECTEPPPPAKASEKLTETTKQ